MKDRYPKGVFEQVRLIGTGHPALQRRGFSELFIDTGASVDKYAERLHGIFLRAAVTSTDGMATYGYDDTNQLTSETYVPSPTGNRSQADSKTEDSSEPDTE